VPLIMLLSVCNQLLSIGSLRKEMVLRSTAEREGALAYIAGGLFRENRHEDDAGRPSRD
jgi:hypothetical protein